MRRPIVLLLTLGLAASAWSGSAPASAGAPCPQSGHIASVDFAFVPSLKSVPQGGTAFWDWCTTTGHNAVDLTPMELYDSGSGVLGDPPFSYTFVAAGRYPYVCTFHVGMDGTISVKLLVDPHAGDEDQAFDVTWAATPAPDGFVYDVQVRRPGSENWKSWKRAVKPASHAFHPDAGPGTYRFRSRMRILGTGHADWSKTATIHVDPAG